MIPKAFTTIAIKSDISNIVYSKVIDKLNDFVKIDSFSDNLVDNYDIIITDAKEETRADFLVVVVGYNSIPIQETNHLRVFQPFLYESINNVDCSDLLVKYIKTLIFLYNLPIISKNTTLELE